MNDHPKFIIVGCMKAGTTQLVRYLQESREIYLPSNEFNYFDKIKKPNLNHYLNKFKLADKDLILGEKTAAYSYVPGVAKKIHEILPEVKLIWVLRNPINRAYSNYWHAVKAGKENKSFADCVANDKDRFKKNIFSAYLTRSLYLKQIQNYLEYFHLNQMHFVISEELKANPQAEINKVCEFLNVSMIDVKDSPNKSNVTTIPRSIWVEYYSRKIFDNNFPYKIIHHLNKRKKTGYSELNINIRKNLIEYFRNHNIELGKLLKKDLSIWDK